MKPDDLYSMAFPSIVEFDEFDDDRGKYVTKQLPAGGLTKREYFAGLAMMGFCALQSQQTLSFKITADLAVNQADALLAALNEKKD